MPTLPPDAPARLVELADRAADGGVRDALALAQGALSHVQGIAPAFIHVGARSRWLDVARKALVSAESAAGPAPAPGIGAVIAGAECWLLLEVSRTALAARQPTAAMATAQLALDRAVDADATSLEIELRTLLVTAVTVAEPARLAAQLEELNDGVAAVGVTSLAPAVQVQVHLARATAAGARGHIDGMRTALAAVARLGGAQDPRLPWCGVQTQLRVVQLVFRGGRPAAARQAVAAAEAALLKLLGAARGPELAHLRLVGAGLALLGSAFDDAAARARSALDAVVPCGSARGEAWLGMPLDLAGAGEVRGALDALMDGQEAAEQADDPAAITMLASSRAALALAAGGDGAAALQILQGAEPRVAALGDDLSAELLHEVTDALLHHLGLLSDG
jgi:hypothetical protein